MLSILFILLFAGWDVMPISNVAWQPLPTEQIIDDIYNVVQEQEDINYEDLQEQLLDIAAHPINLNEATYDDLAQLRFLNNHQIDQILLYVYKHPMDSIYELALIPSLKDYEIRNLLPFVRIAKSKTQQKIYPKEVFYYAHHEILARADARYIEEPQRQQQSDPFYTSFRYKFSYHDQIQAAFTLRRPTGADAVGLQYGGYIKLSDISHLKTLVLGNFQGTFGQGLIMASPFHMGKSNYVLSTASSHEGLNKYSSVDGQGLHGIGATLQWKQVQVSTWYSWTKANDSVHDHLIGLNATYRYRRFKIGLTAAEHLYSDTLRYYYEHAAYNQHYFRGKEQFLSGLNARWNYGIVDLFGEVAVAQNKTKWGYGMLTGARYYPVADVGLILLYRYYSPYFDNTLGYAFSETSRINDENGLYAGVDIKRLSHWRFLCYGDIFRFAGIKYGIPYAPSMGYDAQAEAQYIPTETWDMGWRARARRKAKKDTYSLRYQYNFRQRGWTLRTECQGNVVRDSMHTITYGISVMQDIEYAFSHPRLTIQGRLQGFYIPHWDNRIYAYEHDVLYGYSIPAAYGVGGRFYINLRWRIIEQLSLYLRVSETIYTPKWMSARDMDYPTRTDIHLLLRATL